MTTTEERLQKLRQLMRYEHLAAVMIPCTDPHRHHYPMPHWQTLAAVSGFTGQAAMAAVTPTAAALWTDSRYWQQAREQLSGTGFEVMSGGSMADIAGWTQQQLLMAERTGGESTDSTEVAIDGTLLPASDARTLIAELRRHGGLTLRTNLDVAARIWTDRPTLPSSPIRLLKTVPADETAADRMARIRRALNSLHADGMLTARTADIAWALNLHDSDGQGQPAFAAFLLVAPRETTLFVSSRQLTADVTTYLSRNGIATANYEETENALQHFFGKSLLMDPTDVSLALIAAMQKNAKMHIGQIRTPTKVIEAPSPIADMTASKSSKT